MSEPSDACPSLSPSDWLLENNVVALSLEYQARLAGVFSAVAYVIDVLVPKYHERVLERHGCRTWQADCDHLQRFGAYAGWRLRHAVDKILEHVPYPTIEVRHTEFLNRALSRRVCPILSKRILVRPTDMMRAHQVQCPVSFAAKARINSVIYQCQQSAKTGLNLLLLQARQADKLYRSTVNALHIRNASPVGGLTMRLDALSSLCDVQEKREPL